VGVWHTIERNRLPRITAEITLAIIKQAILPRFLNKWHLSTYHIWDRGFDEMVVLNGGGGVGQPRMPGTTIISTTPLSGRAQTYQHRCVVRPGLY